jgi:hypothetical protein
VSHEEEVVVPFPKAAAQIARATSCRGTLIASSLRALETEGHLARYFERLSSVHAASIQSLIAGQWISIELAIAHYEACDQLELHADEQLRMGGLVADRIQKTFLATVMKLANDSGLTPWVGLKQFGRIYDRLFIGGGTCVTKVGPKDARIEIVGLPLAGIPYFRNGYRGVIRAGFQLFGVRSPYVTLLPKHCTSTSLGFRAAWV